MECIYKVMTHTTTMKTTHSHVNDMQTIIFKFGAQEKENLLWCAISSNGFYTKWIVNIYLYEWTIDMMIRRDGCKMHGRKKKLVKRKYFRANQIQVKLTKHNRLNGIFYIPYASMSTGESIWIINQYDNIETWPFRTHLWY